MPDSLAPQVGRIYRSRTTGRRYVVLTRANNKYGDEVLIKEALVNERLATSIWWPTKEFLTNFEPVEND